MAKKKSTELTLEEKLEQALVPVEKQPYEVPENWCWTYLEYVADWGSGGTPSRKHPEYYAGNIPWIKTGELNNDIVYDSEEKITAEAMKNSSAKIFPINTVAIAMYGATIGKVGLFGIEATTNQACACAKCKKVIDYKYLFHYAISQKDNFIGKAKGGAQPNISQDIIRKHFIPLSPLPEQKRIVDRIESLFAKLDEAKNKIQIVLDESEGRKAAILHKAFSGELTAKWREVNNIGMDSWQYKKSCEVCEKITCGKTPTGYITDTGEVPYLKVYNIVNNQIDFETTPQYIPKDISDGRLASSKLQPKDVIMNIVGPPLRKIAIIPDIFPEWNMNQAIVRFRAKEELYYKFLYYMLISPDTLEEVVNQTRGVVGQANISVSQSRDLDFVIPSKEEQYEIVRIAEKLLDNESNIYDACQDVLSRIEDIRKAILSNAFRGELATNLSDEENAIECLKRILEKDDSVYKT